jgi:two-component system chemotaxis response regulator CheB
MAYFDSGPSPGSKKIRVLVVDDSPTALLVMTRILSSSPAIEVVGTAPNGKEGLEQIPKVRPDVICTDLYMPIMDGFQFIREVMERFPLPILVVSISGPNGKPSTFKALEAGALEVISKPVAPFAPDFELKARTLIETVIVISGVVVFRKWNRPEEVRPIPPRPGPPPQIAGRIRAVAIGGSTGGPQALKTILSNLPGWYALPIFCVQHISPGFLDDLVKWLASLCEIRVRTAEEGMEPEPGVVHFPQEGTNLLIDGSGLIRLAGPASPSGLEHVPSITATFQSVGGYYGAGCAGVLLSGMGEDGAEGMRAISKLGGITVVQDEATSVVFGMGKKAVEMGAVRYVLPVEEISDFLLKLSE